jgi:4-hydroxy-tetrahydrodipicolinate reductase
MAEAGHGNRDRGPIGWDQADQAGGLIVGHGRMGKLVETLSPGRLEWRADIDNSRRPRTLAAPAADVAVDFTDAAVLQNLPLLVRRRINVVVGTTGLQDHEAGLRRLVDDAGVGAVVASNFSLGANLFQAIVEQAAARFARCSEYGAWVHEAHHAAKRDAPSGTAIALQAAMKAAGYARPVDMSSTRAGSIPGTHTVGFDGPSDTVTLTHTNRDRGAFARGALEAARWVVGRRGWFTMKDVIGLE